MTDTEPDISAKQIIMDAEDNGVHVDPRRQHSTSKKGESDQKMASMSDTLSFVFGCGFGSKVLFTIGCGSALLNGLVGPMLAVLFSVALSRGSNIDFEEVAYNDIRNVALGLVAVGVWAFLMTFVQTVCFEIVAFRAAHSLNLQWFSSLLRQDAAFFDVYDVPSIASMVQPTIYRYKRGMGSKFGEGIQYLTTVVGGIGFSFVASWRISIMVLAILPFCIACSVYAIHLSQTKTSRANESYRKAGAVAYTTVSSLRTVLAFNGIHRMVSQYKAATEEVAKVSTKFLFQYGAVTGLFVSSYICMFVAVSMYGAKLLYTDIELYGCDPSAGMFEDDACETTGAGILGAFLGFLFAAEGMSQVATFLEALVEARVAVFEALKAINRTTGAPPTILYQNADEMKRNNKQHKGMSADTDSTDEEATPKNREENEEPVFHGTVGRNIDCSQILSICCRKGDSGDEEVGILDLEGVHTAPLESNVKAIIPRFEIDSSDLVGGEKPSEISGRISFHNVSFSYPTRPGDQTLQNFSIEIEAGKTIAFVGPSGSGKSTIIGLVERFYDPTAGTISLDGINIRDYNVSYLRSLIGYVGQEPTLFDTTIRENIEYGNPGATQEQIEEAARLANAHDFISEFPDGYSTQVGNKGSQLSGGQKQRIAIARVLVSNPSLLLLDEATSALDGESELIVQDAIDNVLEQRKLTTLIVAHRLSTIRNADVIAVVAGGEIVETGTHEDLMAIHNSYYRKLVNKQEVQQRTNETDETIFHTSLSEDSVTIKSVSTEEVEAVFDPTKEDTPTDSGFPQINLTNATSAPHINFVNVHFSYPSRPTKPIFSGFNLSIKCGETVALVGPSGGGKSTTVALLERFYDPSEGVLQYMGHDAKELNPRWYRDQIGLVSQEPTLLNDTIARNIAFGQKHATSEMIVEAAKQANADDFIRSFPDGYNTLVGNRGGHLSGGQKQRIAIARALLKKPKVLILDEATSALDTESEAIVQAALDRLMASRNHTTIVIAHRLSTIRSADRIAYISEGKVREIGTHEKLIEKPNGRYKRLVESQKRTSTMLSLGLDGSSIPTCLSASSLSDASETSSIAELSSELDGIGTSSFSAKRIWREIAQDMGHIIAGSLGSLVSGAIYPMWGIMFAQTLNLIFLKVYDCPSDDQVPVRGFDSCQEYWTAASESMRSQSIQVGISWSFVVVASFAGAISSKVGFGTAAERLNKRIRDSTFVSLVKQEVSFFDVNSIGRLLSVLQDDTTKLYAFAGEPLRMFCIGISSVVIGVTVAFLFVWPVALLSLGCIPLMGYALSLRMGRAAGVDRGSTDSVELDSPTGILVETLLNIRTVAALTLESRKFDEFRESLLTSEPNNYWESAKTATSHGMAYLLHHWVDGLLLFFAGWLLHTYPAEFTFEAVLNSNFALYFSLFGLGIALKEVADKEEIKLATSRVFYILDRQSLLDPTSYKGLKLD